MRFIIDIEDAVYRDDRDRLERAYRIADPWNLDSTRERARYEATNEFIRRQCGTICSVLEIGSGEGHQTLYLLELTSEIVGLELSARAVARARRRCPRAQFIHAAFPSAPKGLGPVFDVVLAAEVLYYMRDVDAAVTAMSRYGRWCVASCYRREAARLDRHLLGQLHAVAEDMTCGGTDYRFYCWRPEL